MQRKLVVFDLDGTLFQAHITSVQAIKAALADCSLPVPDDESIRALLGGQMEEVCSKLAPDSDAIQREYLGNRIAFHEKELVVSQGTLFDGVEEMLTSLHESGYTLAICSNGKEEYIETVLAVCNIGNYFSAVKGKRFPMTKGQRLEELLKEFRPTFAVLVGDRIHDFDAAKENHIPSIGVTYGYGGEEVNLANYMAKTTSDVVRLVQELDSGLS